MAENTKPGPPKKEKAKGKQTEKGSPPQPSSAKSAGMSKSEKESSPKCASSKPNSPRDDTQESEKQQGTAGIPVLPLGQRENNRNQFNLAKARADAAAAQTVVGSRTSTYPSSWRQSGSSQVSFSSKASNKTGRPARGKKKKGQDDPIQVFNENGKDVTPKPLSTMKPTVLQAKLMSMSGQFVQGTEFEHSPPIYSRTGFSVTSTAGSLTPETIDTTTDIDLRDFDGQDSRKSRSMRSGSIFETPRYPKKKVVIVPAPIIPPSQKEMEKLIPVTITESLNQILLSMRGHNVNAAFETVNQVLERNTRYEALLMFKQGSDNYQENVSQTLFSLDKNKEAQASALSTQSNAIQVNSWDILDSVSGKVKQDQYQPWEVVPHGSKDAKTTNPTTTIVLLPELFTYMEGTNAQSSRMSSPPVELKAMQDSRRQSHASRKGSTIAGHSWRPSAVGGQQSRRTSVASRRPSASGGTQGMEDLLRSLNPALVVTELGSVDDSQTSAPSVEPEVDISKIKGLFKALEIIERACVLNTYHDKLLEYKDFRIRETIPRVEPPAELDKDGNPIPKAPPPLLEPVDPMAEFEEKEPEEPKVILPEIESSTESVHWLWDFGCNVTDGRNISCMAWNKVNKNLIAVGYGEFEFAKQRDGMLSFWSLKNPRYPHALIPTLSGVTALDFATATPSLLAVGFYSGNLAIYDVRNPKDMEPMVQSSFATGKHSDPVWKVQWVDHAQDHGESFISVSTDGRVSQWSIKKDLEHVDLMKLKKISIQNKGAQPPSFISRRAGGLCFEFSSKNPNIYLVGTEEGAIYKCDRLYSEQYMMVYNGHNGPVYQVRWSPFLSYLFLSCSSDWTVRLWNEELEGALIVFQTTNVSIADVHWSYSNSCVFAVASTDGHLELWNMQISVIKPTVVYLIDDCVLSCMMLSDESPIILVGGSKGSITILRLDGYGKDENDAQEAQKLKDMLVANVTQHGVT